MQTSCNDNKIINNSSFDRREDGIREEDKPFKSECSRVCHKVFKTDVITVLDKVLHEVAISRGATVTVLSQFESSSYPNLKSYDGE